MGTSAGKTKATLGFVTVVEDPQHGLFGGYLILNTSGRPLEFHCTAPLKPNRAQQILYGATLESFLYGEQIGQTLLGNGKFEPLVVCTDREPMLSVRELVSLPVALVMPEEEAATENPAGKTYRLDAAHGAAALKTFSVGRNRLAVPSRFDDSETICRRLSEINDTFDLAEPFQRIREAIREAQQAAR